VIGLYFEHLQSSKHSMLIKQAQLLGRPLFPLEMLQLRAEQLCPHLGLHSLGSGQCNLLGDQLALAFVQIRLKTGPDLY
jgi:hypothetical protein